MGSKSQYELQNFANDMSEFNMEYFEDTDDSVDDPRNLLEIEFSDSENENEMDRSQSPTDTCNQRNCSISSQWSSNIQQLERLPFTGKWGLHADKISSDNVKPIDMFSAFIDDDFLQLMVTETNRYAEQYIGCKQLPRCSRMQRWKVVTVPEMRKFLGIIAFMGVINYPRIEYYWKTSPLYKNSFIHSTNISYNRFSLILRFWHFVDNSQYNNECTTQTYKVQPLIDKVMSNVTNMYTPGEVVVVDETTIPCRGRLNAHKYGLKIYKLCSVKGFVFKFSIYCGQDPVISGLDKPGSVVATLAANWLHEGRLIITDDYYTSPLLANYLIQRKTDLCGILRKSRQNIPKDVVRAKLKRGETAAMQLDSKITVLKWHDKRDVLMLSTCHGDNVVKTGKLTKDRTIVMKPKVIVDYNSGKQGIDVSDQMSSYHAPIRKSVIWYKKVAIELIFGSILRNSYILYSEIVKEHITLLEFTESLVYSLVKSAESIDTSSKDEESSSINEHFLSKIARNPDGKIKRRRCCVCYKKMQEDEGRMQAANKAKQVDTECTTCNKAFCIPCFENFHRTIKK